MRYWKRIDTNGKTTTVESYSFDSDIDGAIEITEDEFDAFIKSLPVVPNPPDAITVLQQTVAKLQTDVSALKAKVGVV